MLTVMFVRYRVELFFSEETDEAMFVAFDTEMIKLTNVYVLLKLGISRSDNYYSLKLKFSIYCFG